MARNPQILTTKTHSLALRYFGSEAVVSCFRLGANGQPDTDSGEEFVRTVSAEAGASVFRDFARLLECNAADFDAAIDAVFSACASLSSCLHREVQTEATRLRNALMRLDLCTLKRRDARREESRASAIRAARACLDARLDNIDAKILGESARRAERGQP